MGMFDTYGTIQLKVGECACQTYKLGDKVDIPDGVYVAPEGVVVIHRGLLVNTYERIQDKWGGEIITEEILSARNPVRQAIEQIKAESAYLKGLKDGITRFAWWKNGVQQVGTCGNTLKRALDEVDKEMKNGTS